MNQHTLFAHTWSVFLIFLRLGFTSFGGPIAHLSYFRNEFVSRRQWLSEAEYADLVGLCQFLPGPTSSQVGMALGYQRIGWFGAIAAWLGFTMPSALALMLCGLGLTLYTDVLPSTVLYGFKLVALAVIIQAICSMLPTLCTDWVRRFIALLGALVLILIPSAIVQVVVMLIAAGLGWLIYRHELPVTPAATRSGSATFLHVVWLVMFVLLLIALPMLAAIYPSSLLELIDAFYRTGSLVFGGGHVVLPLLQAEMVETGKMSEGLFLAGYGLTQALPGPLFTFAAFLGAATQGWLGGLVALLAIFLPSFLLLFAVLPFWTRLRSNIGVQAALMGVNAAVVGLLLAALYLPAMSSQPLDWMLVGLALILLIGCRIPAWSLVLLSGVVGWSMSIAL